MVSSNLSMHLLKWKEGINSLVDFQIGAFLSGFFNSYKITIFIHEYNLFTLREQMRFMNRMISEIIQLLKGGKRNLETAQNIYHEFIKSNL